MEQSYRNISFLFVGLLVFALVAFTKTYFGLIPNFQVTTTLKTHFHVTTILLWFTMLIIQPILIRTKRIELHRLIGKSSYILAPLMVLGVLLIIDQEQTREKNMLAFMGSLLDVPLFLVFYGLAIYYRKKTAYHIRFMVLTIIPFIPPAAARFPFEPLGLIFILLFGFLIFERFTNKVYKPYVIALILHVINLGIVAYLFLLKPNVLESFWNLFWKK
jgi:hypothetical protein